MKYSSWAFYSPSLQCFYRVKYMFFIINFIFNTKPLRKKAKHRRLLPALLGEWSNWVLKESAWGPLRGGWGWGQGRMGCPSLPSLSSWGSRLLLGLQVSPGHCSLSIRHRLSAIFPAQTNPVIWNLLELLLYIKVSKVTFWLICMDWFTKSERDRSLQ